MRVNVFYAFYAGLAKLHDLCLAQQISKPKKTNAWHTSLTRQKGLYHPDAAAIWLSAYAHALEHNLLILGLFQQGSSQVIACWIQLEGIACILCICFKVFYTFSYLKRRVGHILDQVKSRLTAQQVTHPWKLFDHAKGGGWEEQGMEQRRRKVRSCGWRLQTIWKIRRTCQHSGWVCRWTWWTSTRKRTASSTEWAPVGLWLNSQDITVS